MATVITGTGVAVPPNVVTNEALARIMDTSDEWIVSRTGVGSRRFVDPGTSTSDLGAQAVRSVLSDAGVDSAEVDAVVCATMTPDRQNPGIAGALQHKSGVCGAAVFDLRQQCSGFLFGLDLADMLIATERARTVVVVGAEVHAGYLPWGDAWDIVLGRTDRPPTDDERALATRHRDWSVLFGDGAGAMVLQQQPGDPLDTENTAGILGSTLKTDGAHAQIAAGLHHPSMNGGGLYRLAVETMPAAVREVLKTSGCELDDLGLVVAHQANDRILNGARRRLGADETIMPSNIGHWGNTTAGTLPILYHEMREQGRVAPQTLVAFTSFGAGTHWGAVLYREPESS